MKAGLFRMHCRQTTCFFSVFSLSIAFTCYWRQFSQLGKFFGYVLDTVWGAFVPDLL